MAQDENRIKGGVIIQGSLLWEDENNCLPDDKEKGKARREWRESALNMDEAFAIPFPIRYGRCSSSRLCTYTMVISREYLEDGKSGQAIIVPFREDSDATTSVNITTQIQELAKVEGISGKEGTPYAKDWGVIAIWINPKSNSNTKIAHSWSGVIKGEEHGYKKKRKFDWIDGSLITKDYELDMELNNVDMDFLLLTYIKPKHKNLTANEQRRYPTPQEIAEEIRSSGYSTYFCQNRVSGIITSDDEEIFKHIK